MKAFTESGYQTTDIYLMQGTKPRWAKLETVRPSQEEVVDVFIQRGYGFWDKLVGAIKELRKVESLEADEPILKRLRSEADGAFSERLDSRFLRNACGGRRISE
jgi:hypothetical protein